MASFDANPDRGFTTGGYSVTLNPKTGNPLVDGVGKVFVYGVEIPVEYLFLFVVGGITTLIINPMPAGNPTLDPIQVFVNAPMNTASLGFALFTYDPIPCLAPKTRVLMADGTLKQIQDVKRGDYVAGDLKGQVSFRVSRVTQQDYRAEDVSNVVVFSPGSIAQNMPAQELRITGYHPILYKGARREASCFRNMDGVKFHPGALVSSVFERNNQGVLAVYDLQFDFDAQYVAEGVLVQSRSPWYKGSPLPRELYFQQESYRKWCTSGTINHPLPMAHDLL